MMSRYVALICLLLLVTPSAALCAEPKAEPSKSVDDALLEDLDNELLEGVGDLKDGPKRASSPSGESNKGAAEGHRGAEAGEDIGGEGPDPEQDPLGYISQEMRKVQDLLPERKQQKLAEELQKRIVEDLSALIEQAQKQQQAQQQSSQSKNQQQSAQRQSVKQPPKSGQSSPSSQASNKPASDSSNRLGRAEAARPDPELLRGLMKDAWGHLPERDREQMRQVAPERFLPQYELMIERYYRRLAEERSQ